MEYSPIKFKEKMEKYGFNLKKILIIFFCDFRGLEDI